MTTKGISAKKDLSFEEFKAEVIGDYTLACESREASLLGRKEVLTGKAKFGIFGDGKELAQIALAKAFKEGDFRSGYYRDQTWMFAMGKATVKEFFAQLYAHPSLEKDPFSAGRQMNAHFGTHLLDENGDWLAQKDLKNSSADTSPTASQMARALGLAQASKFYRNNPELQGENPFSNNGDEICFTSIGDASTSEGIFWESINAAGVLQIPLAASIWDDGYGISVPKKYQTTKENISEILKGFASDKAGEGYHIYKAKGWDYPSLVKTYMEGVKRIRQEHKPAIFHIIEVTQPQGHSTSGSHERYKSTDRLQWEEDFDCIEKMKQWMITNGIATEEQCDKVRSECKKKVREMQKEAWNEYVESIQADYTQACTIIESLKNESSNSAFLEPLVSEMNSFMNPMRKEIFIFGKKALRITAGENLNSRDQLITFLRSLKERTYDMYSSHLHSESERRAVNIDEVPAEITNDSEVMNGFEVLNKCFENLIESHPEVIAFGEDVGKIGDVNQGFAGLQEKFGEHRVFDVGIREASIMGQGIGLAMRGIRPIAEIQYLDYLIYGLQPLVDDLSTLHYRSKGRQKSPMIIRTRGHRLEGIWHTGSPIGMIVSSLRGINVLVPRNMTQAAGFYNTMIKSDEPALIIECLNGYRLKETLPDNYKEFTVPVGKVETLIEGEDITMVSYGSTLRIAEEAIKQLGEFNISVELIDVQSLLPFDLDHNIVESIKKTNRVVFLDEDVPGGGTAYLMQKVLEEQEGYLYLDSKPITISAMEHRSAYGSDGDYFCKPNAEDIFEQVYNVMHEFDPEAYPVIY